MIGRIVLDDLDLVIDDETQTLHRRDLNHLISEM